MTQNYGLLEYDGKSVKRHFADESFKDKLLRICIDAKDNIYVGTSDRGVYQRTAGTAEFRHIDVTGTKHVSALYCAHDGQLMIGYDGNGVSLYNPQTGVVTDNPYFSHDVDLSKCKVYSIVEDASGCVWLGLLQKGVFMQPKKFSTFRYIGSKLGAKNVIGQACVISAIIDSKGRCWVGTDKDGLYCLDYQQNLQKHFVGNGFPSTVMSLAEDASGRIWIGSYNEGFGYVDAGGGSYHKFPQYQGVSGFSIVTTPGDELWVATMGQGLLRIDGKTGSVKKVYTMQRQAADQQHRERLYLEDVGIARRQAHLYCHHHGRVLP